jgi:hypothetical protein
MYHKVDGVRGWFFRLCFGHHWSDADGVALHKIGLGAISVPVKLVSLVDGGEKSSCYVVSDFHGVHSSQDGKHRPVMSFAVFGKVEEEPAAAKPKEL